jgi:hypothetical protein
MRTTIASVSLVVLLVLSGCALAADTWPERKDKTAEQFLADVIRWQQRLEVRISTGEMAHECFTDLDLQGFLRDKRPGKVAASLKNAPEFGQLAAELGRIDSASRSAVFAGARSIALPTWAMMGYVDRDGRGQTEAGHRAELMIAAAIVDAFASAPASQPQL